MVKETSIYPFKINNNHLPRRFLRLVLYASTTEAKKTHELPRAAGDASLLSWQLDLVYKLISSILPLFPRM